MTAVWTFSAGWCSLPQQEQPAWSEAARRQQPAPTPAQPPSRAAAGNPSAAPKAPHPKCARTGHRRHTAVPGFEAFAPLWCGRLNSTFAARVLPPRSAAAPASNTDARTAATQGDLHYRNPAGQIVHRPTLTLQEARNQLSSIEWAVRHVLRLKYPEIHHEIMVAALEYKGDIAPGADPDFPNSVLATVPPEPDPADNTGAPPQRPEHRP